MKKNFLIALSALAIQFSANSQLLDLRAHGGIGVVSLSTDVSYQTINGDLYKQNISTETMASVGVAATLGERFFIQPGVTWQSLQVSLVNKSVNNTYNDDLKLSMITVPLKLGFRVIPNVGILNVRLFGGIDGQFITSVDHRKKSDLGLDIQKTDFNNLITYGDFGMGLDVLFFFADCGYRIGLNSFYNSGDKGRANMFYANLGLKLKL